jgi:purine nucleosidase
VQTILEKLDPPRWPRLGVARAEDSPAAVDVRDLHGTDGLGNLSAQISELHHQHAADKVICDAIRLHPGEITLIALGPLTNIARVLQRDPDLATLIGQLVIFGGSTNATGDVTPAAEFNFYADPEAARFLLRCPVTMTLVPLEVSRQLIFNLDFLNGLPEESTRVGRFLRHVLPFYYRAHRQHLGLEGLPLGEAMAALVPAHSDWFETEPMAGDVETTGTLTKGMTVFDRRTPREWRRNLDVVVHANFSEIRQAIERGLRHAGQESQSG